MTYTRVIPRDLFNEADLLKCYGRLWILLDENRGHVAELGEQEQLPGAPFEIWQDESDGSLTVVNVPLRVRGVDWQLCRPLNARAAWPLYAHSPMGEEYRVFDLDGNISPEFWIVISA